MAAGGSGADPVDFRCASGRFAERRNRLLHGGRLDGAGKFQTGQDVFDWISATTISTRAHYARIVAKHFGTEHHELVLEPDVLETVETLTSSVLRNRLEIPRCCRLIMFPVWPGSM